MGQVHSAIATIEPKDSVERYEGLGVKVLKGSATLVDPWTVEVNGARRTARAIILATGGEPLVPPFQDSRTATLTSDTLWQLTEAPERCLVLGAGPIAASWRKPRGPGVVGHLSGPSQPGASSGGRRGGGRGGGGAGGGGPSLRLGAKAEAFTPAGRPDREPSPWPMARPFPSTAYWWPWGDAPSPRAWA